MPSEFMPVNSMLSSFEQLSSSSSTDSFTDNRDGKTYKTVNIGIQTWMAENLKFNMGGSQCYDNDDSNCEKFGHLYNWDAAMGFEASCNSILCADQITSPHRGICPEGWHVPTKAEFELLTLYAGGWEIAGRKLKSQNDWDDCGPLGSDKSNRCDDEFGFSVLPGGERFSSYFYGIGSIGNWWTVTEDTGNRAYNEVYCLDIRASSSDAYISINCRKPDSYSLRCIKD
jgi:uncharacterized protein (TIGR02145 family)